MGYQVLDYEPYVGYFAVQDDPDASGDEIITLPGVAYINGEKVAVPKVNFDDIENGEIWFSITAESDGTLGTPTVGIEPSDSQEDLEYRCVIAVITDYVIAQQQYGPIVGYIFKECD